MKETRIRFKVDKTAPKPYNFASLKKLLKRESRILRKKIAMLFSEGSPWLDLVFTGGTFQVFLGKKKPSWQ